MEQFDMFSKNLTLVYESFNSISVKVAVQIPTDVGLFENFDNKDEVFRDYSTFTRRRGA